MNWNETWVDLYKTLELDRNVTPKQIKKKYHKLAHKYHPDENKGSDAEEKFSEITEAYKILSHPNLKHEYDIEYDKRLKEESFEPDFESERNHYTKEEQEYAKKYALKILVEKELEKATIVIDAKNEIIYSAYEENVDKFDYYKNVKKFVSMANDYLKGLYELAQKCYQNNLLSEIETINEVIVFLEENIKNIPLSPKEAIEFMQAEEKRENLLSKSENVMQEITTIIQEIETLYYKVYTKEISHIEFYPFSKQILMKAKDILSTSRQLIVVLQKNNLEKLDLDSVTGKLGAYIKTWPEDYEAAHQLGACLGNKKELKNVTEQFDEYVKKWKK